MPRGGPRPGFGGSQSKAGRPMGMGKRLKLIQELADEEIRAGSLPVVVMLRNKRFYDEAAYALKAKLDEHIERLEGKIEDVDAAKEVAEAARTLSELNEFRMQAQSCASDVASFVHPKLGQLQISNIDEKPPVRVFLDNMTLEEMRALFREEMRAIKAGTPTNLVLEHRPIEDNEA